MSTDKLMKEGTRAERHYLAMLVERGLVTKLCETAAIHPDESAPFDFSFETLILSAEANTIGYALMGLPQSFMEIWFSYRAKVAEYEGRSQNPGLLVAAEMSALPYQLLWETEFLRFFGLPISQIIKELRS